MLKVNKVLNQQLETKDKLVILVILVRKVVKVLKAAPEKKAIKVQRVLKV